MADSLHFELIAPAESQVGAVVSITLRLTNVTPHPVEAHFLGREIAFDIVVTDEHDALVWQRLKDRAVPSILQIRMLAPGEAMEWKETWRPAREGRYRLYGALPTDAREPMKTAIAEMLVR